MSSIKYYVADYNGILTDLKMKLGDKLTTPRDADAWIVWQDVLGSFADIIKTQKQLGLGKKVYCVQHGRGSTTDYGEPNRFSFNADKYLCWGNADYRRMFSLGYGERVSVVGCPLNTHIQPKVPHKEKVVLFVPVNTGKEEPENLAVYYELLKLRYDSAQAKLLSDKTALKDKWGYNGKRGVSFNDINQGFDVITKILPWHQKELYHGSVVRGFQDTSKNNQLVFDLLRNVDMVVGLDEGTTEIFAYAHDVPVVIVDGFNYRQYKSDDKSYTTIEGYKTKAATHVKLEDLAEAVKYGLEHPEHLRKERAEVAEDEMGISHKDPVSEILKVVRDDFKA